jgi:hypothetical protein
MNVYEKAENCVYNSLITSVLKSFQQQQQQQQRQHHNSQTSKHNNNPQKY